MDNLIERSEFIRFNCRSEPALESLVLDLCYNPLDKTRSLVDRIGDLYDEIAHTECTQLLRDTAKRHGVKMFID